MSKWISVKTQPIPYHCYVLAYAPETGVDTLWRTSEHECFTKRNMCYVMDVKDITHWQPLPEPPKEE